MPLARSDVGIWNAIFSPPSPGGPMDVIVKARHEQQLVFAIVCVCECTSRSSTFNSLFLFSQLGLFGGLRGAYYDGTCMHLTFFPSPVFYNVLQRSAASLPPVLKASISYGQPAPRPSLPSLIAWPTSSGLGPLPASCCSIASRHFGRVFLCVVCLT